MGLGIKQSTIRKAPAMNLKQYAIALVALAALFTTVNAAHAAEYFGAIAYSPSTGHYGFSYGKDCVANADIVALQNCIGADRRVVVWVANGSAALAVNNNGGFGTAWSTNCQAEADQAALNYAGGPGCGAHIICEMATGV
jgi:serine/threonine-protein kinase